MHTVDEISAERPFPGLRPFKARDSAFFFGREEQIYALYNLLALSQFVAVVGSSGSGKSSLVRAGLLSLLKQENQEGAARGVDAQPQWQWLEFRPGTSPLRRLADRLAKCSTIRDEDEVDRFIRCERLEYTLRRSSFGLGAAISGIDRFAASSVLLVVDQFEELFRYGGATPDRAQLQEERALFVQLLLEATTGRSPQVRVLITMRSDFIGDCSRFDGLPEAVSGCQFLVPALTREQREEVIRRPIEAADAAISSALVERLLNDLGNETDQLPVLQHCLLRLWESAGPSRSVSPRRKLEPHHYDAVGRLEGALSQHADEILAGLEGHDLAVEQVFRALSEVDKEGRATRRPITYGRLRAEAGIPEDELRFVLDRFRADDCSFLVPSISAEEVLREDTTIDVGHEALLRRWERISGANRQDLVEEGQRRGWLWAEEEDGALYRAWLTLGRGAVLPLDQVEQRWDRWRSHPRTEAWSERYGGRLPQIEQLFQDSLAALQAELLRHEEEQAAERARVAREREQLERTAQMQAAIARRNRLFALFLGAFALLSTGLGTWAWTQKLEADAQRKLAENHTEEVARIELLFADAAVVHGLGLAGFNQILDDLTEKEKRLEGEASESGALDWRLRELSVIHFLIALLSSFTFDNDRAIIEAKEYDRLINEIARRHPEDRNFELDRAASANAVGLWYDRKTPKDFAGILGAYRTSVAVLEHMKAADPENLGILERLQALHFRIGDTLKQTDQTTKAVAEWRVALGVLEQLAEREPHSSYWLQSLIDGHQKIAYVASKNADNDLLLLEWQAIAKLQTAALRADPLNDELISGLIKTKRDIGEALTEKGDPSGASAEYVGALDICTRTYQLLDFGARLHLLEHATKLFEALGKFGTKINDEVAPHRFEFFKTLRQMKENVRSGQSSPSAQEVRRLADLYIWSAEQFRMTSKNNAALSRYRVALAFLSPIVATDGNPEPLSESDRTTLSQRLATLGDGLLGANDPETALEAYENALLLRRTLHQRALDQYWTEAHNLSNTLVSASWASLLRHQEGEAVKYVDEAEGIDPGLWVSLFKAHAYLLAGRVTEAEGLYISNKDGKFSDGSSFLDEVKGDFATLRTFGIDTESMRKVEARLGIE